LLVTNKREKIFLKLENVFFAEDYRSYKSYADIVLFLRSAKGNSKASVFNTLQIDLPLEEKILFAEIGKNYRYEINRAEKRDELCYSVTCKPTQSEIEEFCFFYNSFAANKGLLELNMEQLYLYRDLNALVISYMKNKSDELLCSHLYLADGTRALGLYFPSSFRMHTDNEQRTLIGRANKYLHWLDIKYFKARGFLCYDFGGLALDNIDKGMSNINEFKIHFGGNRVVEYDFYYPLTLKGKIMLFICRKKFSE